VEGSAAAPNDAPTRDSGAPAVPVASWSPSPSVARPGLEIRRVAGPAIVVDGGRVGHMHEGVPHGGAMAPERLARANALARNERGAAAIEIYGSLEVVARGGSVELADDVRGRLVLADGEVMVIATEGRARVRYLAVRGGIDVPVVLGGRGTLLVAAMGGYEGRALRRGDVVVGADADESASASASADESEDVDAEIVEGPDADAGLLAAMEHATFTILPASDRIGTRLAGPAMPPHSMQSARDRAGSKPMVPGAIELTPSGLVVLGPDHPTTGGYPVVALVPARALGRFLARPIGASVRFRRAARSRG
jgi:allophanate hydrolase subunit 2